MENYSEQMVQNELKVTLCIKRAACMRMFLQFGAVMKLIFWFDKLA